MIVYVTFKSKIEVDNKKLRSYLNCCGGCTRFVKNWAIQLQGERRANGQWLLPYNQLSDKLTELKHEAGYEFLNNVPAASLQQALRDISNTFERYILPEVDKGKQGWPDFRSKHRGDSFKVPQLRSDWWFDEANSRVWLPKYGYVHYFNSRPMELKLPDGTSIKGKTKNYVFKREGVDWFVFACVEFNAPKPEADVCFNFDDIVGIDVGVVHAVTLSDGRHFDLDLDKIRKIEDDIAYLNRKRSLNILRRKQMAEKGQAKPYDPNKPSRTDRELLRRIRKKYILIKDTRDDFYRKVASAVAQEYKCVAMERLNLPGMVKSAKGTVDEPGKGVKRKTRLNRSLARVAMGTLQRKIQCAVERHGGDLIYVNAAYTSIDCPECGYRKSKNRVTRDTFRCMACNYQNDADVVGGINIKKRALEVLEAKGVLGAGSPECALKKH